MKVEIVQRLEEYFAKNSILRGNPASEAAISAAERQLGCKFAPEYAEFLRLFGCGVVGPDPVFGIGADAVDAMGSEDDVVTQTKQFRAQHWPGLTDWYVISVDGRGNPIGVGPDGRVRLSDHDVGDVTVIAENFESFLAKNLSQ